MKKIILLLVVLALVVPATAMAAAEFSLGGFIKLDTFWDSSQAGKNLNTPILRNNNPNFHHGRFKMTAQGSRFNFTIKGPKLFGAQTTGFIEMDFDTNENQNIGGAQSASNNYTPRLRHAMFRFNWPETELLLGQYWSMFCEAYPESVQDGPFQGHGMPTARLPQVRVTQKFLGDWQVAALIGQPNTGFALNANAYTAPAQDGEAGEAPQVQGKVQFEKDMWGKAAYYGKPTPFTARIIGGWQRGSFRPGGVNANFLTDGNGLTLAGLNQRNHQYLNPWMVMGNVFVPVIPTHSANLAGTAALMAQWYVAQGANAFGEVGVGSMFKFSGANNVDNRWDQELIKSYGGYVSANYYFNNQWFMVATWGMSKIYGVDTRNQVSGSIGGLGTTAYSVDQFKFWEEFDLALWYRPIQAIKFGLQYSYSRTDWLQKSQNGLFGVAGGGANAQRTDIGDAHRVEFVGFFYF